MFGDEQVLPHYTINRQFCCQCVEGEYAEERVVKTARDRLGSSTIDEQYQYLEEQLSVIDSQFKGG